MKHIWNSFRFQMFASFGITAILVGIFVFVSGRASQLANKTRSQATTADDMGKNGYIIITQFHAYIDAGTERDRSAVKNTLDQLINDTETLQGAFQQGDAELDANGYDPAELDTNFDAVETSYKAFKLAMQNLFKGNRSDWEALVTKVQTAGEDFGRSSDLLAKAVLTFARQEDQTSSGFVGTIALAIGMMLFLATIIIVRATHDINGLVGTAQSFADGNYDTRANTKTVNEVALVGRAFNQMAEEISGLFVELQNQIIVANEARTQAEKADQVKSAFLASVSHELRTPLNAIINFSKFVIKGMMGPVTEQQTDALNKVVDSGKHLLNLINDVLDISKIESGSLTLFLEPNIDVRKIIDDTTALASALLEGKPVEMRLHIEDNLPQIRADRQRLRQIVTNIISNACKFTEEGFIDVSAQLKNGEIYIRIQDTGPGIAAEDYSLVFESFKQTSSGLRQGNGTGLGMPISKRLTEAMGGKLWFESEIDKGSTFFVSLPVKSEEPVMAPA